jgi:hypothetical protein
MHGRLTLSLGFAAGLLLAGAGLAQDAARRPLQPGDAAEAGDPVELPKMIVHSARLEDYPLIPKAALSGGGLAPSEPPVYLMFPGSAYGAGVSRGFATVCVELDEKGNAVDYLLIAYTEKYFGDALMRNARDTRYSPRLFKGVAVPARFNFGYEFRAEFALALSSFDAVEHRQQEIRGGRPDFKYYPVTEEALDNRLENLRAALPYFPDGYTPTGTKADWVMVTLYIDETGRVRVPQVESASSPLLVRNAFRAVHYWQFKPPTVQGRPVLVYAAFAVSFIPAPAN